MYMHDGVFLQNFIRAQQEMFQCCELANFSLQNLCLKDNSITETQKTI